MSNQFNDRLNSLFETADFHVTNAMVVRGMTEFGCRISRRTCRNCAPASEPIRHPKWLPPSPTSSRSIRTTSTPRPITLRPRSQVARQTSPSSNSCTTCACGTSPPVSSTSHRLHRICLSKWRRIYVPPKIFRAYHRTRIPTCHAHSALRRLSLTAQGGLALCWSMQLVRPARS